MGALGVGVQLSGAVGLPRGFSRSPGVSRCGQGGEPMWAGVWAGWSVLGDLEPFCVSGGCYQLPALLFPGHGWGGRILPQREPAWGCPSWGMQDTLLLGLSGGQDQCWLGQDRSALAAPAVGCAGSSPVATSEASSDLEAIASSRRCRETTCPCVYCDGSRHPQQAQGCCLPEPSAGGKRRAPAQGRVPLRRPPGWESTGRRAVWEPPWQRGRVGQARGSGGITARALCRGFPRAMPGSWPLQGVGLSKGLQSGAVPVPGQGCPAPR